MSINLLILQFLLSIQGVETNFGTILNHKEITNPESMHYGDTAIGRYGLMPNTIKMLDHRPNAVELVKSNSLYESRIARKYAIKILQSAGGCPLTASILWLKGPKAKPTPIDFTTPRFKRFMQEWQTFSGYPINKDPFILKYCRTFKH